MAHLNRNVPEYLNNAGLPVNNRCHNLKPLLFNPRPTFVINLCRFFWRHFPAHVLFKVRSSEYTETKRFLWKLHVSNYDHRLWFNVCFGNRSLIELLSYPLPTPVVLLCKLWYCLTTPYVSLPKYFLQHDFPGFAEKLFITFVATEPLFVTKPSILFCMLRTALWTLYFVAISKLCRLYRLRYCTKSTFKPYKFSIVPLGWLRDSDGFDARWRRELQLTNYLTWTSTDALGLHYA